MFARALNAAHICVRCQQRVARQRIRAQLHETPSPNIVVAVPRRWQSHAVALAEDEGEDSEKGAEALQDSIFGGNEEESQDKDHRRAWSRRKRLNPQFRLARYADLGVDALGSPAGIIVLPESDRNFPIAPDLSDEPASNGVQSTLESENQPLTWEDVKKTITNTQQVFLTEPPDPAAGQDDAVIPVDGFTRSQGILEPEEWERLRHGLSSSFTRKQLQRYVEESGKTVSIDVTSTRIGKNHLAHTIAKEVWGYQMPADKTEETPQSETEVSISYSIKTLEVLLMSSDKPFRKIADLHSVQVDVFRAQGQVRISGGRERVAAAKKDVLLLKQSVRQHKFVLKQREQEYFSKLTPEGMQLFLQKINQKYGIFANVDAKHNLEIVYLATKQEAVDSVRRDIVIATRNIDVEDRIVSWPRDLKATTMVPYQISYALRAGGNPQWSRISTNQGTGFSDTFKSLVTKAQHPALKEQAISLANSILLQPPSKSSKGPVQEISARFGQVLFDESLQANSVVPDFLLQSRPRVVTQIPLFPQILSQLQHISFLSDPRTKITSEPPSGRFFEMRFAPCNADSLSPWIHIKLRGTQKSYSGLDQPLEIISITAVSEERRSILLLPSTPVDVVFSNKLTQELFVPGVKDLDKHTANLLQTLAQYMNPQDFSAEASRHKFRPFVTLPIPSALNKMSAASTTESSKSLATKPASTSSAQKSKSKRSTSSLSPVQEEYVLMSIDPLDTTTIHIPNYPKFALEHMIYPNSVTANTHAQSQNLRLIQNFSTSLSSISSPSASSATVSTTPTPKVSDKTENSISSPSEFVKFVECALEVANWIGLAGQAYTKSGRRGDL